MTNQEITLTKEHLFWYATIHLTILGMIIGLVLTPVLAMLLPIKSQTLFESLTASLSIGVLTVSICIGLMTLIASIGPIKQLKLLKRQENYLSFSFNEEMQQYGIVATPYASSKWFIVAEEAGVIVLRRDYVAKIERIHFHQTSTGTMKGKITLITTDRKIVTLKHRKVILSKLKLWLESDLIE